MTTATLTEAPPSAKVEPYRLSPQAKRVFVGLMLGMLVASISQTIVGPAMPRIVAELGGMDHYSWVATAAMLVSAITVPIVGKLSDLYGRRGFYLAGLAVFMVGSIVSGFAGSFWVLVLGRAIQGLGMGTIMPLSQTIIGDIIPARQRGKYQGLMGAVFGVTSVAGPLAGGFITDHWGWRWLFFAAVPIGLAATAVVARFLHLPHQRREAKIDYLGIATLTVSLVSLLLATSLGGTSYPWGSTTILGLYAVGVVALVAFLVVERRAEEPVIPLRLFRSSVFSASNIAALRGRHGHVRLDHLHPGLRPGRARGRRHELRPDPDAAHAGPRRDGHPVRPGHHPHRPLQGDHALRCRDHGCRPVPPHPAHLDLDPDPAHRGDDRARCRPRHGDAAVHPRRAERRRSRRPGRGHRVDPVLPQRRVPPWASPSSAPS